MSRESTEGRSKPLRSEKEPRSSSRPYSTPRIKKWGTVRDLTRGAFGQVADAGPLTTQPDT